MNYIDKLPNIENILFLSTALYLFIALFVFGFGVSGKNLGIKGSKTFTVSDSLEHGKTSYIVTCLLISFIFITILLLMTKKPYTYHRILLLLIIYVFFILICWYTPTKNSNLHNIFTGFIIVSAILFLMITYWTEYNRYVTKITYSSYVLLFIVVGMFITGLNSRDKGDTWTDIFAVFELLLIILFTLSVRFILRE